VKHHVLRPQQQADPVVVAHQRVQHRQRVIHPPAAGADRQHEGRGNRAQRLVEIGGHLFGHKVQPRRTKAGAGGFAEAVEIADHRFGAVPMRQRPVGPAIGRHQARRAGQRQRQIAPRNRPARYQRDPTRRFDNRLIHWDTGLELRQCVRDRNIINPSNYPLLSMEMIRIGGHLKTCVGRRRASDGRRK